MSTIEKIQYKVQRLPKQLQEETLEFVELLLRKNKNTSVSEDEAWSKFSLEQAMKGFENEEALYTESDLKEKWT